MYDDNAYIVFSKLLMLVNENGEYATGRRQLAELLRKNDRTLYGVLVRLENEGIIRLESRVRYTIIHINNWKMYQVKSTPVKRKTATDRATEKKQGSFADIATDDATTRQPQRNHTATTAQHSYKNKEARIKNKDSDQNDQSEKQRASPEAVANAKAKLLEILERKKS